MSRSIGIAAAAFGKLSYAALEVIDTLWRIGVVVYFVVAMVRRRLRYRVAIVLAALLAVWAIGSYWGGTAYDKTRILKSSVDTLVENGSGDIDVKVAGSNRSDEPSRGGAVFWMFIFAAAGISVRGTVNHGKWHSLELLVRRRFLTRSVGWSVASGLLCGIGIAAIPYWIAAGGGFAGSSLILRSTEVLVGAVPRLRCMGFHRRRRSPSGCSDFGPPLGE